MTAADESRVVWRHEPRTEAGQGLLETLDPTDGSALAQILAIEDQAALAARSEPRAELVHMDDVIAEIDQRLARSEPRCSAAATPPAEGPTHYPHCNDRCVHYMEGSVSSRFSLDVAQREPGGAEPRQGAVTEPSTPPAEGLDVERLAEAIRACRADKGYDIMPADAAYIVAEYERLAALAPEQPE